jgi:hypothetical protein
LIPIGVVPNSPFTASGSISLTVTTPTQEKTVIDLVYLAGGVGVLLLFVGYAILLRRA